MMREKHMPNFYWAEAASTAVVHELTPYEIFVGRKTILSHLKVFGSIANIRELKPREARREVREMYPHRILVCEKGIQVFQPFDPSVMGKS